MNSDEITHAVPMPGDPIRGISPMAADRMPLSTLWQTNRGLARMVETHRAEPRIVLSPEFSPTITATAVFVNSTLGAARDGNTVYRFGTTVPRLCPHGAGCDHDEINALGFDNRLALGCATAYAESAFVDERIVTEPEASFMLVPGFPKDATARDDVIMLEEMSDDDFTEVEAGPRNERIFRKLPTGHAVVVSERWLYELGVDRFTIGMNIADATFGMMSFTVPAGEHGESQGFHVMFCTQRENLGRRDSELSQPLATAVDMVLESLEADPSVMQGVEMIVRLGSSAKVEHFRHNITLPTPVYNGGPNKMAITLAEHLGITYDEYVERYEITQAVMAGDDEGVDRNMIITPSDVMDEQYPGALEGGFVYGANEVTGELERRTADGCPGYGELCHLDYRNMTRDTIAFQLERFGVVVDFDEGLSVDPSDPENAFASNRADQLAGIATSKTSRTFVGVSIALAS